MTYANEQTPPADEGRLEAPVRPLPTPKPRNCWAGRLKPCTCGADVWGDGEDEYGSLGDGGSYERFLCEHCKRAIYVELPD